LTAAQKSSPHNLLASARATRGSAERTGAPNGVRGNQSPLVANCVPIAVDNSPSDKESGLSLNHVRGNTRTTRSCNGLTTVESGVPGCREDFSPAPPSLATPFPAGRKSAAEIANLFLPAGNSARILLTTYLAFALALGGEERAAGQWLVTTPVRQLADAPPESGGELLARLNGRLHPDKIPVYATIYMKTRGLRQNSKNSSENVSH
jgi:hypothetical protein